MVFQLVVSQCQKCAFPKIKQMMRVPFKQYVAPTAKFTKKASKDVKPVKGWLSKEEVELKRKDRSQPKPFGLTAWEPTDDVYVTKYYPWPTYDIEEAVQMLKKFQQLDFTYPKQPVYVDLKLDMNLDKKKKVEPFVGTIRLPYPFTVDAKKVLVFTENASEITLALENGAAYAGGSELVQQILDDEIQADFYVAVPGVLSKLTPLKNKLRKQFPKSGRGSLGMDIPKMLELFKQGHEYTVENECVIKTKIASLDMPCEQIVDNLDALIKDICNHKPLHHGPFVERGLISSATSEALRFNLEQFLPQLGEEKTGSEVEL
ncbi:large ribosomal subunit protein uL1m isoform X1 [Ambystoma mexicanum]|uniref:large ribosomal subunit protein uL1m isoform X1 n=1 Tax=Ambystoma mexicanum TaxID=8296 RepID=UPI0037E77B49